ncbi:hypothetical protein [Paenibacillus campi]|uniref:hypothetical protein n=1 Tax=Paenibacillus campi TaxID=3106031 RepID=UPI002AFF571A|nr:hypothetical protein [Paenibacillus sp. SGZ-1009]
MMKTILIIIALMLIGYIVIRRWNTPERQAEKRIRENERFFNAIDPPDALVPAGHPCEALANKLEASIPAHYTAQLWQRIQSKHPHMSDREFEWRWHEMKRYLLICALFREVPMFSSRIDDIWHEMLMFTRKYEQFCQRFYGYMLHHSPHGGSVSQPDQRALFDWAYGELFPLERANTKLWGSFFRHPLPSSIMNELLAFSEHDPQQSLFNSNMFQRSPEARAGILYLHRRFVAQSQAALRGDRPDSSSPMYNSNSSSDMYNNSVYGLSAAGAACVYYSYLPPADFSTCVDPFLPNEAREQQPNGGTSSSCGTGFTSDHSSNNNHHGGGHDSGGHSHSSCSSSSCSSSSCSSSSSCGGGGGD